MEVKGTIIDNI